MPDRDLARVRAAVRCRMLATRNLIRNARRSVGYRQPEVAAYAQGVLQGLIWQQEDLVSIALAAGVDVGEAMANKRSLQTPAIRNSPSTTSVGDGDGSQVQP